MAVKCVLTLLNAPKSTPKCEINTNTPTSHDLWVKIKKQFRRKKDAKKQKGTPSKPTKPPWLPMCFLWFYWKLIKTPYYTQKIWRFERRRKHCNYLWDLSYIVAQINWFIIKLPCWNWTITQTQNIASKKITQRFGLFLSKTTTT